MLAEERLINNYLDTIFNDFSNIGTKYIDRYAISMHYLKYVGYFLPNNQGLEKTKIPNQEIIDLSRSIIKDINEEYIDSFDSFVDQGTIRIWNKPMASIFYRGTTKFSNHKDKKGVRVPRIDLVKENNYTDVSSLVHEFMHSTNWRDGTKAGIADEDYFLNIELSEFVPIFSELYAKNELEKKYNIPNEKFDSSKRFHTNCSLALQEFSQTLPFYIFFAKGSISYKNYCDYINESQIHMGTQEDVYTYILAEFIKKHSESMGYIELYRRHKDEDADNKIHDRVADILRMKEIEGNYIAPTVLCFSGLTKDEVVDFNETFRKRIDFKEKLKSPAFAKVLKLYNDLPIDLEPYKKTDKYLKLVFDENGAIRKS